MILPSSAGEIQEEFLNLGHSRSFQIVSRPLFSTVLLFTIHSPSWWKRKRYDGSFGIGLGSLNGEDKNQSFP